jgi:anti-sigma factor RsiW
VVTGKTIGKPIAAQVKVLKEHVIAAAAHLAMVKAQIAFSQAALAALDPADVNKVVVPGYPPAI